MTSPTSTQHSAQHRATVNSSAQAALGIIKSLVAPNHRPLRSAPFTCFTCIFTCASEAGGVSRPRSAVLVVRTNLVWCTSVLLYDTSWNETWHVRKGKYSTARSTAQHRTAPHSTAQHRTAPHRAPHGRERPQHTAGHSRTARQGTSPYGTVRHRMALLC